MNLEAIQAAIRGAGFDGWLFYDHHHRDPIAGRILGLDEMAHITRRWYYFVPASGEPRKLVHRVEQGRLDAMPGVKGLYSSWQELAAGLEAMLAGARTLAMQYSPNNAIMYRAAATSRRGTTSVGPSWGSLARKFATGPVKTRFHGEVLEADLEKGPSADAVDVYEPERGQRAGRPRFL